MRLDDISPYFLDMHVVMLCERSPATLSDGTVYIDELGLWSKTGNGYPQMLQI
jgi:hypothetical protein